MGHKAHPVGLRLGIHRKWKSNWFFDSKNYTKFIHLNLNIDKFFKGYLFFYGIKTLLLKSQIIKLTSNQIFIFLFYYRFRKKKKKVFLWANKNWTLNNWKKKLKFILRKKIISSSLDNKQNGFLNSKRNFFLIKKKIFQLQKISSLVYKQTFFFKKNYKLKNFSFFLKQIKKIKKKKILKFFKTFLLILKNKLKVLKSILLEKKKNSLFFYKKHFFFFNTYSFHKILKKLFKNLTFKNSNILLKKYNFFFNILKKILLKGKFLKLYLFYIKKKIFNLKNLPLKAKIVTKKKLKKNILKKKNYLFFKTKTVKNFLSKLTNSKITIFFINTLSFTKFFFYLPEKSKTQKKELTLNVLHLQKSMVTKYKYDAIFIKDFVHVAFICLLLKITQPIVNFIGEQFKRLPKNRKQFKLLKFINQTLKLICQQRKEICGFQFQIKGRLNRRNRTHKWTFKKGILPLQTSDTRVEYAATDGFTRRGLIGIKIWIFYNKIFKETLKKSFNKYIYYSKYKKIFLQNFIKLSQKNKKDFSNRRKTFTKQFIPKTLFKRSNFKIKNAKT